MGGAGRLHLSVYIRRKLSRKGSLMLSRRSFINKTVALTTTAPILLLPRKSSAQAYPVIDQSYLAATNQAAFALYQACANSAPTYSQLWDAAGAIRGLSSHLDSISAGSYLGQWVPPAINANGVMPYDSTLQNFVYEYTQQGNSNWNFLTADFMNPNGDAEPLTSQVTQVTGPISLRSCLVNLKELFSKPCRLFKCLCTLCRKQISNSPPI